MFNAARSVKDLRVGALFLLALCDCTWKITEIYTNPDASLHTLAWYREPFQHPCYSEAQIAELAPDCTFHNDDSRILLPGSLPVWVDPLQELLS